MCVQNYCIPVNVMVLSGSRAHCALDNFLKDYISQGYSKCQRGLSKRSRCFGLVHTHRSDPLKGEQRFKNGGENLCQLSWPLPGSVNCGILWLCLVVSGPPCPALPCLNVPCLPQHHGEKPKRLQRSHAMREDSSPPPELLEGVPPTSSHPSTTSGGGNTLTVTASGGGRRRIKHQGSSQGSFDGSSPCLSRGESLLVLTGEVRMAMIDFISEKLFWPLISTLLVGAVISSFFFFQLYFATSVPQSPSNKFIGGR